MTDFSRAHRSKSLERLYGKDVIKVVAFSFSFCYLLIYISFFCSVIESSESSLTVPHIDIKPDSLNTEAKTKEQEYVLY